MKTETEFGDRSGKETDTRGTVTTQIAIVSTGFTLYPTYARDDQIYAYGIAAPRVLHYPHRAELAVSRESVVRHTGLEERVKTKDDILIFDMSGYDIRMVPGSVSAGALATGLDMVPQFESLCCGIELATDWRTSPFVDAWLTFEPGTVVAIPDQYTFDRTWAWKDCSGTLRQPRLITNRTAYIPTAWNEPKLQCEPRAGTGRSPATIEFTGNFVHVAFANVPNAEPPDDFALDLAHIYSMLKLSKPSSPQAEVSISLGRMAAPQKELIATLDLPKWLLAYLRKHDNERLGRPHCGARQMRAPAA